MCEYCNQDGSECAVCGHSDTRVSRRAGFSAGVAAITFLLAVFFAALAYALQHQR